MSKGLFDKASSYREEFLARPNEGLLAQALDYLNSKDNAEAAAEIKSSGEPTLPPLPDASEFHPIDDPTVADIMPDEETVRQRMAEIEEQVCAAENGTSTIDSTNSTEQSDAKSEETFFLEGNAVQEQQPDYEEEVLIIDLPQDDDPFAALMAQMNGGSEPVQTEQEDVIPTEANEMSEAEESEEEIPSVDENLETPIADKESAEIEETADAEEAENADTSTEELSVESEAETAKIDEEESPVEEVTQGTSFVGNNIIYDADAVTQKTFTDSNVSFTELSPTEEPAPESDDDLPSGILTTEQSEDDTITVPAEDEDTDMTELPAAEDLPAAEEKPEKIAEEENYFADDNAEWIYPADQYDENGNIKDNEQEILKQVQDDSDIQESSGDENLETQIADEESAEIEETDVAEEAENVDTSTEETDELIEEISSGDENAEDVISTEAEKSSSDEDTPKQYDDYLAVLDDISAQTAAISIDENMFDNFLACVADRFEIDKCGLLLFDPDDGQFKCMAKIDYDDETEEKLSFDLNYNNIYSNLANKKSYLVHRDEPQFGGLVDIMSEKDFAEAQYQLWLPFVFSSRIIGIMLVTHSVAAVTDDYIRALEVAGRLNGATLYNLYQQYAVMCEEYEDDEVDAETLAEENEEEMYNEEETPADDEIVKQNEVVEAEKSADGETAESDAENSSDDEKELSEEELAEELMSEWDIAAGENEEADEQEEMHNAECVMRNEEDDNEILKRVQDDSDIQESSSDENENEEDDEPVISSEAEESDESESDEEVQAEIPSVIEEEAESDEEISSADENESVEIQDDTIIESSPEELAEAELAIEAAITDDVIEAEYTIPSDDETAGETDSIIIDESSFGEESDEQSVYDFAEEANAEESEESIEELEKVEESVISTEANEESEAEKSNDSESIIIEDTGLALPEDEPVEVLPIPDDMDAKYRGLAAFMHDLRETGAALSLCRVILTSFADVTAAVGEFSLGSFAEDIKGTTQSIIGGDSFVEVTDPDKFYIVLPNAEKEEAQAAAEMIIEQIVGLFSEAFGNAAEFRFECAANDTFTQSDYLSLLNELS